MYLQLFRPFSRSPQTFGFPVRTVSMAGKRATAKATPPSKEAGATNTDAEAPTASTAAAAAHKMKANTGEGMNPVDVSKMLGLLKYRADDMKNKKGVDMEEAKTALELYKNMDSEEKRIFLNDFLSAGAGKNQGV